MKQEDVPTTEEIISAKINESTKELEEHFDAGFNKLAEQLEDMERGIRNDIAGVKKGIREIKAMILRNKLDKFTCHLDDAVDYLFSSDYLADDEMLTKDKMDEVYFFRTRPLCSYTK